MELRHVSLFPPLSSPKHPGTLKLSPTSLMAFTAKKTESINHGRSELEQAMQSLDDRSIMEEKTPRDQQVWYNSLISLCISNKALREGHRLRAHLARTGFEPSLFLENQFINLYSRCGEVGLARELFDGMQCRNLITWNAMIAGYCSNECFLDAIALFRAMIEVEPTPNQPTYLSALRAAVGSGSLEHGEQIHSCLIKRELLSHVQLGNALIGMYSKFGRLEDAEAAYKSMVERDEVSWNSLIAANAQKAGGGDRALDLFIQMQNAGLMPNEFTFGSLLGSKEVGIIEELHSQIIKRGLASNVFTATALSDAYARFGNLNESLVVFDTMPVKNTVAWNSVITSCFENDVVKEGLRIYLQMREQGKVVHDDYTISILIKAATDQLSATATKQLHGLAVKMGSHKDTLIGNSLIAMYAEHEAASDSWRAFKDITEPDVISWNSMVQSYNRNERFDQALALFVEMKHSGLEPDEFTYVSALAACASLGWLQTGRALHSDMIKSGMTPDDFVGSTLIDMYAKSMAVADAKRVFVGIENKDLITWNSIVAGLAHNGDLDGVMKLLCLMREENLQPDNFTYSSALAASANSTATRQGRQIHAMILKSQLHTDTVVANALITMYTRTGSTNEAMNVFSELIDKNVVSWTSMIGGYAQSGYAKEAIELFDTMERSGVAPNGKTFVALLTACSYAGKTEEGDQYFKMMETKYGIKPRLDHYACMVDILGRAGRLKEVEEFIEKMPYEPNALIWRMLLSACRTHGDLDRGKRAMEKILELEPNDSAAYVLLSNLYASLGNWDGVGEVRQLMRENGVKKEPANSFIEVHDRVHEFMAGDHSHPQAGEICLRLRELFEHMKDERQGYATDNNNPGEMVR